MTTETITKSDTDKVPHILVQTVVFANTQKAPLVKRMDDFAAKVGTITAKCSVGECQLRAIPVEPMIRDTGSQATECGPAYMVTSEKALGGACMLQCARFNNDLRTAAGDAWDGVHTIKSVTLTAMIPRSTRGI